MTSEEKAKEIVGKYVALTPNTPLVFHKQCALIAVDEILADYEVFNAKHKSFKVSLFWQQVKQEIEKL